MKLGFCESADEEEAKEGEVTEVVETEEVKPFTLGNLQLPPGDELHLEGSSEEEGEENNSSVKGASQQYVDDKYEGFATTKDDLGVFTAKGESLNENFKEDYEKVLPSMAILSQPAPPRQKKEYQGRLKKS